MRLQTLLVLTALTGLGIPVAAAQTPDCDTLDKLVLQTPQGPVEIANRMAELGVKGVSLALIHDFRLQCTANFGIKSEDSQEPIDDETLFQVASISKPVTAVAVLRLVQDGVLDLDSPVNDQLSGWQIRSAQDASVDTSLITIRHILNHTAGLTTPSFPGYKPGAPLPTTLQILDGAPPANSDPVVASQPAGEAYAYSGGGYTVLDVLVEQATGQPFKAVVQDTVFDPVGMAEGGFEQPISPSLTPRIAMGYAEELPEVAGGYHVYPELAAAGLWTTARDPSRFVIGLQLSLNDDDADTGLLSRRIASDMMTPVPETMSGLGIVIDEMYFTHGGHNRGYMSRFLSHDTDGYGLIVLTNAEQPRFIGEVITGVGQTFGWEDF